MLDTQSKQAVDVETSFACNVDGHDSTPMPNRHGDLQGSLRQIDIDLVRPGRYQPRHDFVPEALAELAASIRAEGVLQPILVRPLPGTAPVRYEIIAGERRWRAAQSAGLHQIPALVRPMDDRSTLIQALVENLQREDLNPLDTARGIARLIEEFQLTHEEAARRLGRSRDAVSHLLRILKLDPGVLAELAQERISVGHAKRLVGLPQPVQQQLATEVMRKDLSVRALERRIRCLNNETEPQSTAGARRDPDIVRLEQRVGEIVGAETRIDYEPGRGQGRIAFTFHSLEALEGILDRLGYRG